MTITDEAINKLYALCIGLDRLNAENKVVALNLGIEVLKQVYDIRKSVDEHISARHRSV